MSTPPPKREKCPSENPKTRRLCVLDKGHAKKHYDGSSFHWDDVDPSILTNAAPRVNKSSRVGYAPPEQKKPAKAKKQPPAKKPAQETDKWGQKLGGAGYCGATFNGQKKTARNIPCTLSKGHAGPHENTSIGVKEHVDTKDVFDQEPQDGTRKVHEAELEQKQPENIGGHEIHPAAALFPMITEADWPAFVDNIRTNKQRKRIVRLDGLILDGRNRLRACVEIGIEPQFREFGTEPGDGADPIAFVISENIHRRHLDETQRAFVGAKLVPMYEAQARERMLAGKAADPSANLREGPKAEKASQAAARAVNVSPRSIEAALQVERSAAPEVLEAARDRGHIKVSTAAELAKLPIEKQQEIVEKIGGGELRSGKVRAYVNQEKKRDIVRKINEGRVAPLPMGPFGLIYGDYPWHYDNSDQHEGSRGHLGYPTMKLDEIVAHALEVAKRAADNCVLALWVTNLYITRMAPVLEAYGADFERHTVFTWPKLKFGVGSMGRGQTEHLVVTVIGKPVHTLNEVSTLLPSWKPARPGEHSSKPAEVAALLAKHCGGPFLELFARDEREGWTCWGAETDKFKTEAA